MSTKMKKLLILNLPYVIAGMLATNIWEAWRLAEGADTSAKLFSFFLPSEWLFQIPFRVFIRQIFCSASFVVLRLGLRCG